MTHTFGASLVGICRLKEEWVKQGFLRGLERTEFDVPAHWKYAVVIAVPHEWDSTYANPTYGTSYDAYYIWSVALLFLLAAVTMNNPGLAQYGVFGVFFQLTGSSILFIILFVTIVLSLFIRRPWCRLACPIDGVLAYVRTLRDITGRLIRRKGIR